MQVFNLRLSLSNWFILLPMRTIALLIASNVFMTFAWYGNLKFKELPLWKAIMISWGIAFFEYCLMVPANRGGYLSGAFTAAQLKIMQEVITLVVFALFSVFYLKEGLKWNYAVSFFFILCAVFFAFRKFD
jgi:uncharacterized protein (DUF486 family)